MTLCIAIHGDDSITIYDEQDPRRGIVIKTITMAEKLVAALTATIGDLRAEQEQRRARLRAVMEDMEKQDQHFGIE